MSGPAPPAWPERILDAARRLERPLADGLFALLLLALTISAGWLVARQDRDWDWTAAGANRLTPESLHILSRIEGRPRITVFAEAGSPLARTIDRLLARYTAALPDLRVVYLDPRRFPERAREAEVSLLGQILVEYRGRRELLSQIDERAISGAIARLSAARAPWVAVIEGHGERAPGGEAPSDLGRFGEELTQQGFLVRPLKLTEVAEVPVNTHLLVLSTPRAPWRAEEIERLRQYLARGGNLLWLMDPGAAMGLDALAADLGLRILPGILADRAAPALGAPNPLMAALTEYPAHPLTAGLGSPALLPGALAFAPEAAPGWTLATYLTSSPDSWNETGRLDGELYFDEVIGERRGPLPVALALTRPLDRADREQRVLILGDGDFLSNAYLGVHGNRALGLRLIRWLSGGEALPELPPPPAGESLVLTDRQRLQIGLGTLAVLPGLFLLTGLIVRWRRWRQP